jgi:hypothetical protein
MMQVIVKKKGKKGKTAFSNMGGNLLPILLSRRRRSLSFIKRAARHYYITLAS